MATVAGSEFILSSFIQRTKALLGENEIFTSTDDVDSNVDNAELSIYDRLLDAGETGNILKERASEIVDSGEGVSVQLTDFCSKMDELHNRLNRLRVYLENITDEINCNTSTSKVD